jgi:hypothetical protein
MGSKATRPIRCSPEFLPRVADTQTNSNHVIATRSAVIDSNAIMSNILVIRGHGCFSIPILPLYIKLRLPALPHIPPIFTR